MFVDKKVQKQNTSEEIIEISINFLKQISSWSQYYEYIINTDRREDAVKFIYGEMKVNVIDRDWRRLLNQTKDEKE